ncbi:heparin lyase I family protein [uncultured Marivirga sp.]|uniref:heparin lyase I family protein n=1 Tax=uncultured Marivirga sp. TaxID=1123707 RepID=UPI0030EBD1FC
MKLILIGLVLILVSCSKNDGVAPENENRDGYLFEDGFETSGNDLSELFPNDGSRWSNLQQVDTNGGENEIDLESSIVSEGNNSLRIYARASDNTLSKANIEKAGFNAPEGSIVSISANFYIASTENIENLLLIDLECCSCWDPRVPDNQCPGIRLMMKDNDYLSIERGKILGSTIVQSEIAFPRNEWVNVVWELKLSQNNDGINKLFINNQEVLSESGMNMPNKSLFETEFANNGIDFELQEPLFYERFQIGATANPTPFDVELFIDDVKFEIIE